MTLAPARYGSSRARWVDERFLQECLPMDPAYMRKYEELEENHWWWVSRRELIQWCLDRYVTDPTHTRWLDIGCGTGVLLNSYPRIPWRLGVDLDEDCAGRGREKGLDIRRIQPAWNLDEYGQFDLVTMCDVIEHVQDDAGAVEQVSRVLKVGGIALATVPALPALWSAHDVRNHHFRRYVKAQLLSLFRGPRWDILRATYFCTFLLPPIWAARKINNLRHGATIDATDDSELARGWTSGLLLAILRAEARCLRHMSMPLGSSLLLVAQRR